MGKIVAMIIIMIILNNDATAQVIDFGSYESSSATVIAERNLEFGTILKTMGENITLGSGLEGVISIEGVRYLDVFIDITPYPVSYLYLDGNTGCVTNDCRIPFTMTTSYTNAGQLMDNITGAVSFASGTVRFPVLARGGGPPRPPPVPTHSGYTPPLDTAHIYVYGSITTSLSTQAGEYSNIITISVTYD